MSEQHATECTEGLRGSGIRDSRASSWRSIWPGIRTLRRGLESWLEFGDVENQLRLVKPRALRTYVARGMVPFYVMLASEHGYRAESGSHGPSAVRLVLIRQT